VKFGRQVESGASVAVRPEEGSLLSANTSAANLSGAKCHHKVSGDS